VSGAPPVRAFVALGSNLGERLANLGDAVRRLSAADGMEIAGSSRVYETAPVGPPQPDYLNAVVELRTTLLPRELLEACLRIEAEMGRVRDVRWGPRVIDLDLLTFDDQTIAEPDLTVPHPRLHHRAFVLIPLIELDPDPRLPGGRRLADLRLQVDLRAVRPFAHALPFALARSG
jgi:2-amino-4-hydroxy-6-hydroxymethyldihydropteridine diphosphokinase